jgi:hypothetical protein
MITPPNSRPRYSITGYRNRIRTTRRRVLLVEGASDKTILRRLVYEATSTGGGQLPADGVEIDTAESLIAPALKGMSNRDKVERVSEDMLDPDAIERFVGFSDREFRDFDDSSLSDLLAAHHVHGRLVWSRGHSIENYLFDLVTFSNAVKAVSFTDSYPEAIEIFGQIFGGVLRVAAAASLAGRDHEVQGLVAGSLKSDVIIVDTGTVSINIASWTTELERRTGGNRDLAQSIVEAYSTWIGLLTDADPNFVRWICHGHTGFNAIWVAYSQCILVASRDPAEANRVLRVSDDVRLAVMADEWASRTFVDQIEYPREILQMLGIIDP